VNGPIQAIYVKDGQIVQKGQLLVTILPTKYQAALDEAIAQQKLAEKTVLRERDLLKAILPKVPMTKPKRNWIWL
jgi:multidrug resistance efflux pump